VRGFSLIELLVTLVVAAIALGVGVPLFNNIAANQRMSSATNDLVTSLHAARSEALMRRAPIGFCATADGAGPCLPGGSPALGWTVFVDRNGDGDISADDVILQRHGALPADFQERVTTTPADLRFTDSGALDFAPGSPFTDYHIQICDHRGDLDTGGDVAAGRWIQISALGRQQLVRTRTDLQSDRNPLGGC